MEYNETSTAVRQFLEAIETMHPSLNLAVEKGGDATGDWWIDIGHHNGSFTAHWEPEIGFGFYPDEDTAFGEPPSERYSDTAMALRRVEQLIGSGQIGSVGLRDLREVQGLSQVELAERLGIQQAAVSKVERRQDLHLDTLSAIVKALGGTLDMKVRFPGGEVPLRMANG